PSGAFANGSGCATKTPISARRFRSGAAPRNARKKSRRSLKPARSRSFSIRCLTKKSIWKSAPRKSCRIYKIACVAKIEVRWRGAGSEVETMNIALLVLFILVVFVSQASAEKIRIGYPDFNSSTFTLPLAQIRGFFQEEGLQAELIRIRSAVAIP